jgi:hypothetical protein
MWGSDRLNTAVMSCVPVVVKSSAGVVFVGARHHLPHGLTGFDEVSTRRANLTDSGVQIVGVVVDATVHELCFQPAEPFVGCRSRCNAFDDAIFRRRGQRGLKLIVCPHVAKDTPDA